MSAWSIQAGFALVIFSSGAASAASFAMLFVGLKRQVAWIGLVLGFCAPVAFSVAQTLHKKKTNS